MELKFPISDDSFGAQQTWAVSFHSLALSVGKQRVGGKYSLWCKRSSLWVTQDVFWSVPEMCLLSVTCTNSVSSMEIRSCWFCISEQQFHPDSTQKQTWHVITPPNKLGESGRDGLRPSYLSSHCIFLKFKGLVLTSTVPRSGPKGKIESADKSAHSISALFPDTKVASRILSLTEIEGEDVNEIKLNRSRVTDGCTCNAERKEMAQGDENHLGCV